MKPRHKKSRCNFAVDVDGDFWYIETWDTKYKRYHGLLVSYVGIYNLYGTIRHHTYRDLVYIEESDYGG